MKKFTFRGVLDGFRNTVQPQTARQEQEIHETLRPEHFAVKKVGELRTVCVQSENINKVTYECMCVRKAILQSNWL